MSRAALLGQLMHNYKNAIAVSGTHGKTTTTSMLSQILLEADTDPTISVGGILESIGGNIRVGHSDTFITEACEYTNSFLEFFPKISIILNIEEDHMDFFKDIDDIRKSFRAFAHKAPDYGYLVINGEIDNISYITDGLEADYVTFGVDRSRFNFAADNITHDAFGHDSFDYYKNGVYQDRIQLNVTGDHNVNNALAAIAVADRLNLPMEAVKKDFFLSPEPNAASNTKERSMDLRSSMTMPTIRQKSAQPWKPAKIIRMKSCGVFSSLTLIPEPRHSWMILPRL